METTNTRHAELSQALRNGDAGAASALASGPRKPRRTDIARLPFAWAGKANSREAELWRRTIRQLRGQITKPSAAQELMIARIAWVTVHLSKIDAAALQAGGLSEHQTDRYLAWSNTISRMLDRLGLKSPDVYEDPQDALNQYFAHQRAGEVE